MPIELWWQDEARVGQQGTLTRVWAERGSRPSAPRDQRRESAYIFGAVCPLRDLGAALVLPYANAQAMNLHLEEISSQVTQGSHAVLLLDGAGWHQTGGKLRVPGNISLLPLPPYSPELNPAENIWQFLRQNHLSNRVFESYDDVLDACCEAWNALVAEPNRIASIATRHWASVIS
jgi:hypothetical protein